ncbi:hypothetical protein MVI01_72220 [Myxococcus virescens]|uniref:Uncharacterized protein n=1 Tax=Myxococcus virescens TaxID=83456 RepID=A0A511HPC5_9BACT|nr:hypothetical protein MVI01_72220 [Myxococcus virescens]
MYFSPRSSSPPAQQESEAQKALPDLKALLEVRRGLRVSAESPAARGHKALLAPKAHLDWMVGGPKSVRQGRRSAMTTRYGIALCQARMGSSLTSVAAGATIIPSPAIPIAVQAARVVAMRSPPSNIILARRPFPGKYLAVPRW